MCLITEDLHAGRRVCLRVLIGETACKACFLDQLPADVIRGIAMRVYKGTSSVTDAPPPLGAVHVLQHLTLGGAALYQISLLHSPIIDTIIDHHGFYNCLEVFVLV